MESPSAEPQWDPTSGALDAPHERQQHCDGEPERLGVSPLGATPEAGRCDSPLEGRQVPPQKEEEESVPKQSGHVVWIVERWGWDGHHHYSIGVT